MVKNYLIIAIRNLLRKKIYTFINVLGLSIGIASAILIGLMVRDELSFDQHHTKSKRIYRILQEFTTDEGRQIVMAGTQTALGPAAVRNIPEVEAMFRRMSHPDIPIQYNDTSTDVRFCLSDTSILNVLTLPLVAGNTSKLSEPQTALITASTAQKIFGNTNPLGKTFIVRDRHYGGEFTVIGIIADFPKTSTIQFDVLSAHGQTPRGKLYFTEHWNAGPSYYPKVTHLLLQEGVHPNIVLQKLENLLREHVDPEMARRTKFHLQPLEDVHLHTTANYGNVLSEIDPDLQGRGDVRYIYLFTALSIFLVAIACINFINLTTAQATQRSREVGLRKAVGASREQITAQILGEAILLSFLGLLFAVIWTAMARPYFGAFLNRDLLFTTTDIVILIFSGSVVVGILAGLYPAFYISKYQPVEVLRGKLGWGNQGISLRQGLVVFQFTISVLLLVAATVIHQQINFISSQKLGFNRTETIILAPARHPEFVTRYALLTKHPLTERLKKELTNHPAVESASAFNYFLYHRMTVTVQPEGHPPTQFEFTSGDSHLLETFDLELIAGTGIPEILPTNERGWVLEGHTLPVLINETAAKRLNWDNPIGKRLDWGDLSPGVVVGVVKDFRNRSLKESVQPLVIRPNWKLSRMGVKIQTDKLPEALAHIESVWKRMLPQVPFNYTFTDEKLATLYRSEKRFGTISSTFSVLAVIIACLGLIGLAAFAAERRQREISIRKVLGATPQSVTLLLLKDMCQLVLLANIIGWALGWWLMQKWLNDFAYHANMGIMPFALATLLSFGVAILASGFHTIRASLTDPAQILRKE